MNTFLTNHSCTLPLLPSLPPSFLLATIASGSAVMGAIIAKGFECEEFAGAIDVALDHVAAEATAGGEGPFEVEAGAGAEVAEVGPGERFGGEVGGEGAGQEIDGGEADAVDGDAGSGESVREDGGGADAEAGAGDGPHVP